jgi:hypothetical protein
MIAMSDSTDILDGATEQAQRLLRDLLRHQADLNQKTAALPPGQVDAGRAALARTIDAVQGLLQSMREPEPSGDR